MKRYPATYSLQIKEVTRNENGLFIEEIQSDRHQEGRKKGYKGDRVIPVEFVLKDINRDIIARGSSEQDLIEAKATAENNGYIGLRITEVKSQAIDPGVADAPFRTAWPLQMFKRALRDAVNSGKDWIGWTVGDTQNDRYDLSKQVDKITVRPYPDYDVNNSRRSISVFINGKYHDLFVNDNAIVVATGNNSALGQVVGKSLDEVLGKEMAQKIMSVSSGKYEGQSFEGEDLKIGGSGMKGFYDNMLPKEIGKYVKQWGAKVEKSKLSEATEGMYILDAEDIGADIDAEQEVIIRNRITLDGIADFDSIRKAEEWLKKNDPTVRDFWKVSITDELRKAVGAGQALYNADLEDNAPTNNDAEYMAAVKSGDMETAQRMVDKAAGNAPKVYRGDAELFNQFDKTKRGKSTRTEASKVAYFFTDSVSEATAYANFADVNRGGVVREFRLLGKGFEAPKGLNPNDSLNLLNKANKDGYDYVVFKETLDTIDPNEYPDIIVDGQRVFTDSRGSVYDMVTEALSGTQKDRDSVANDLQDYLDNFDSIEDARSEEPMMFELVDALRNNPSRISTYEQKTSTIYAVFDSVMVKSADPVTYDLEGNVIPLSQRFNPTKDSILENADLEDNVSINNDAEYIAAVKAGDMETAQRMVDKAAKAAGYKFQAKHGTPEKKLFTEFGERGKLTGAKSAEKAFFFSDSEALTDTYRMQNRKEPDETLINDWVDGLSDAQISKLLPRDYRLPMDTPFMIEYARDTIKEQGLDFMNEMGEDIYYGLDELVSKAKSNKIPFPKEFDPKDIGNTYNVKLRIDDPYYFTYNQYEVSGMDGIVKQAIEKGHDGIISKDKISDAFSGWDNKTPPSGIIYAVFEPSQIKSADPVTYDSAGNIIPLSKRFNQAKDSILETSDLENNLGEMGTPEEREEIRKQQEAFKDEGKVVGRPDLANPGMSEETRNLFDEEDEIRKIYATRETWDQWRKAGEKLANENEEEVVRTWLAAALQADRAADTGGLEFDAQQLNPELVVAIRIIMERRAKQAGGDPAKLAKVSILRNAYRSARANIARVMAAGVDTFKKPEERHREQLVNLITTLPEKDMRNIEERFGSGSKEQQAAKEQEIEKQTVDQIKRIEKELAKMGVTIDEVLNGEAFLSLSQNRIIRNITDKMDNASRLAVKLMQQGNGFDAIRRKTGLPDSKIEKIRADLYKKLEEKIRAKVEAGMTLEDMKDQMKGALETATLNGLTPEQVQIEIDRIISVGFGIPQSLQKKSGIPTAKKVPKKIIDDEDSLEAGSNRIAQRWIDRLAVSQSDTLAWKKTGKEDELNKLIRAHLAKPVPGFTEKVKALGVTAEQARVLDLEANTERSRKAAIKQWKKENPTSKPKALAPKKAHEVDWNRPEFSEGLESYSFTTDERSDLMNRVVELRLLTGITGTVEALSGKDRAKGDKLIEEMNVILAKYKTDALEMAKGKMKAANYRFDIRDRRHVAIIARTIAAINAGTLDKVQEYYYSSILSGLQTMIINASGVVNSFYQATVDRAFEGTLNAVINSKDNASLGEYQYLMKALRPGLARAWSNAMATWNTEIPFFEEDILNRPPDFQRIAEANSSYRPGSISGTKGRWIRTPSRILMATDDFLNTLRASAEVGSMAFRLAKKQGLKPGTSEFQKFLQLEVNTPGSISWQMAADQALKGSFNAALPGQTAIVQQSKKKSENIVPTRTAVDYVGLGLGKVQQFLTPVEMDGATSKTLKTLTRMLFLPFIRVPFNIMQQGIERSINPISLIDLSVLLAANMRVKNGKFTFNADGGQARLIEYTSRMMQGGVIMAVLAAFGEGDDDDLEKTILVTGSRPYKEVKKGEREMGYRMGLGPYVISIKLPGEKRLTIPYGRIEPFATMMGGTVDTLKAIKLRNANKIGYGEAADTAFKGLVSQINEKTSLRGAADMLEILSGEGPIDRFAADRLASIMPNLVKQALRESDPLFREKPQDFKDMVVAAIFPSGKITGLPPKIDLYGKEQEKPGKTALGRIFEPTDTTVYGASEKTDKMLYNWIRQNPNADLVAPSSAGKTYTDPITKEKSVTMSADQYSKFVKVAGDRIKSQVKRTPFNIDNPTEMDIKRFREIVSDSREIAKRVLVMQEAWRNLK